MSKTLPKHLLKALSGDAEKLREQLAQDKRQRQEAESKAQRDRLMQIAQLRDLVILKRLHKLGRKTKLQLLSLGLNTLVIEKLTKYGILETEYDPFTNLHYLRVNDDIIRQYESELRGSRGD